jgi:hypothetical protein
MHMHGDRSCMEGDKEEVLGHRRVSGCTEAASSSGPATPRGFRWVGGGATPRPESPTLSTFKSNQQQD